MYAHTHIYIYIYISHHVDHPNINALCLGGGTRCSGRISVPCFTSDTYEFYVCRLAKETEYGYKPVV